MLAQDVEGVQMSWNVERDWQHPLNLWIYSILTYIPDFCRCWHIFENISWGQLFRYGSV